MHDLFNKSIPLSSGFAPGIKNPLDSRLSVQTITERDDIVVSNVGYLGMIVFVIDEGKHYKLVDEALNKWEEFGTGSGSVDLTDYQKIEDNSLTTTAKKIPDAINELDGEIGVLDDLKTSNKTSIIESVNELFDDKVNTSDIVDNLTSTDTDKPLSANQGKVLKDEIGDLTNLDTTDKTSVINAVNELFNDKVNSADVVDNLTSTDTDKPLSANQGKVLRDEVGTLTNLATDDQTSLVDAVNEVDGNIGNLTNLQTSVQTSLVDSINEIDDNIGDLTQLKTIAAEETLPTVD